MTKIKYVNDKEKDSVAFGSMGVGTFFLGRVSNHMYIKVDPYAAFNLCDKTKQGISSDVEFIVLDSVTISY